MSQYMHELCCLLIEEFYGCFHASIYSHLSPSGRSNVGQLAKQLHLPVRQVKAGLATLIQLRLVYHHTSGGLTTYQSNPSSAYNLVRCGKLIQLAQESHGQLGGMITTQAYLLGFASVSELVTQVELKLSNSGKPQTNGYRNGDADKMSSRANIRDTIESLHRDKFLINVRSAQFQSDFDAQRDAEAILAHHNIQPPTKGRKGMDVYLERLAKEVASSQSPSVAEDGYVPKPIYVNGVGELEGRPSKRRKLSVTSNEPERNGYGSVSDSLSDSTIVMLSFNNVVFNIRNDHMVRLTSKILGANSSRVMDCALSQIPVTERWVSAGQQRILNIQQIQGLLNRRSQKADGNGQRPTTNGNGNGITYAKDDEEHYTWTDVSNHLATLADSSFTFLQCLSEERIWNVDKRMLDEFLQQKEILRLVGDRLQPPALRILRMLISKGKLDEKTLQEAGLLGAKQLRQTLAELKQMGFVDLQEVPREAQRQPNRTIFLWFHDSQRVCQLLQENIYKAMIRLMQRLKLERKKLSSTLEKVERSDVQGSEEQILAVEELKVLRRLQRTEEWLLGEVGRLDDSIAILRDL